MKFAITILLYHDVIIQSILCIFIIASNRKTNHCNDYKDYILKVVEPKFRHKVYC